ALVAAGHEATLFTTKDWPEKGWASGRIIRIGEEGPIAFADELERIDPRKNCDLLVSLERVWRCDFFRAGDGVHRAWLERKAQFYFLARAGNERDCVSLSLRWRSCATNKCGCWWPVAGTSANIALGV